MDFKNLGDLINCAETYKLTKKRKRGGNPDLDRLLECIEPLKKLNGLVGMEEIKTNIIDQILFYAQKLNTNEMMHTCLTGPPGVGKTTLGKILSEIYCSLGYLKTNKFKVVGKADLVAGFLGQTAIKTTEVLTGSLGGVLFIDEAYSLSGGGPEIDSYAKECIDTINQFLSEHTSNFILIIAGYRDDLEECFFSVNKGLRRRFPWTYDITKYGTTNLKDIFVHQVMENGWKISPDLNLEKIFSDHTLFNNNGGDTLALFDKAKICHSRRVFGIHKNLKKILSFSDITLASNLLKAHKQKVKSTAPPYGMYV